MENHYTRDIIRRLKYILLSIWKIVMVYCQDRRELKLGPGQRMFVGHPGKKTRYKITKKNLINFVRLSTYLVGSY